jgi:hypothetical protein
VASILSESESHEYDGPDPNVVHGEREKRVVTADGRDLELDGPGTDMTGDVHMAGEDASTKVFRSEEFVPARWDDEDHDDDEAYNKNTYTNHWYGDLETDPRYKSDTEDDLTDVLEETDPEEMQVDVDQAGYGVSTTEHQIQGTSQFDLSKLNGALPQ